MVCVKVLLHLSDTPEAAQRCVLPTLRVSPARQAVLCEPGCDLTAIGGHLGCHCGSSGCWGVLAWLEHCTDLSVMLMAKDRPCRRLMGSARYKESVFLSEMKAVRSRNDLTNLA